MVRVRVEAEGSGERLLGLVFGLPPAYEPALTGVGDLWRSSGLPCLLLPLLERRKASISSGPPCSDIPELARSRRRSRTCSLERMTMVEPLGSRWSRARSTRPKLCCHPTTATMRGRRVTERRP